MAGFMIRQLCYCHKCHTTYPNRHVYSVCKNCCEGFIEDLPRPIRRVHLELEFVEGFDGNYLTYFPIRHQLNEQQGDDVYSTSYRRPKLTDFGVNAIPIVEITEEQENERCTICRESFEEYKLEKKLSCGHIFHGDCIRTWLKMSATCPNCKQTLYIELLQDGQLPQFLLSEALLFHQFLEHQVSTLSQITPRLITDDGYPIRFFEFL